MEKFNLIPITKLLESSDENLIFGSELAPYGVYLMSNEDRILFNRSYSPMMHWSAKNREIKIVKTPFFVKYDTQVLFYTDSLSIQKTKILRRQILALWGSGYPVIPEEFENIKAENKTWRNSF